MADPPILIAGGGLTGLSCAYHLKDGYRLVEKARHVGGAAASFTRRGYTFDVTGHWLHLRDENVRRLVDRLLGDNLVKIARRAEIHSHGVRTPYPFQANTFGLPSEVIADCVLGYFKAREERLKNPEHTPRNFEDYIRRNLGDGIAEHFMLPYNSKLWTVPPRDMAAAWCKRFVPQPTPEEIVNGALMPHGARGLGYNAEFLYPREGGIGSLANALAQSLSTPPELGVGVERVDWQKRIVRLTDGGAQPYRNLVSTLPLKTLIAKLIDAPEAVLNAAQALRATSVTYWDVGVSGAAGPHDPHWIYFPEADIPFYRAGSPSAALPSLAPPTKRSYYVETSHPQGAPPPHNDADVVDAMGRVGLLRHGEAPELLRRQTIDCAYVIMDHAYEGARATLLEFLRAQGILSVGRYGAWIYDSMEGAILQGLAAARELSP